MWGSELTSVEPNSLRQNNKNNKRRVLGQLLIKIGKNDT